MFKSKVLTEKLSILRVPYQFRLGLTYDRPEPYVTDIV